MNCNIREVLLDSEERKDHIQRLLNMEGLTPKKIRKYVNDYRSLLEERIKEKGVEDPEVLKGITGFLDDILGYLKETENVEAPDCCYSGLALTGVAPEKKDSLLKDHVLLKEAIRDAGLRSYDPAEAPFNPQNQLVGEPQVVSDIDTLMVVASRFFTFTNLAASSGGGIEMRTANTYNKMPLVIVKKGIYVSRMTTGARRIILVEYENLGEQKNGITDVLGTLRGYEPGAGTCKKHGNTLIGFKEGEATCLPGLIEKRFPRFTFDFNQYK